MLGTRSGGKVDFVCARFAHEVAERRTEIVITKYGEPVAKLVPVDDQVPDSFGTMAGTVVYREDIVIPDHDSWAKVS